MLAGALQPMYVSPDMTRSFGGQWCSRMPPGRHPDGSQTALTFVHTMLPPSPTFSNRTPGNAGRTLPDVPARPVFWKRKISLPTCSTICALSAYAELAVQRGELGGRITLAEIGTL